MSARTIRQHTPDSHHVAAVPSGLINSNKTINPKHSQTPMVSSCRQPGLNPKLRLGHRPDRASDLRCEGVRVLNRLRESRDDLLILLRELHLLRLNVLE